MFTDFHVHIFPVGRWMWAGCGYSGYLLIKIAHATGALGLDRIKVEAVGTLGLRRWHLLED